MRLSLGTTATDNSFLPAFISALPYEVRRAGSDKISSQGKSQLQARAAPFITLPALLQLITYGRRVPILSGEVNVDLDRCTTDRKYPGIEVWAIADSGGLTT